ncbi:cyclomaltodextrinase N-terminal domain-containing protein [Niabella hibiscisoli]|uniref:cyclomaltodextrinase N-terminal domain-containing protein n=1 Tax=Niabella hibiscisoli TaxID=1825928 RepID=UPI001F109806|nr:cyclomaltodextrinase N-terminal domain-containing protein [Niabella hibiscisoli]MCH5718615.1 cyclomaltodextrinase N-terminal domain-containing protein [Niabella hibiscisoli]
MMNRLIYIIVLLSVFSFAKAQQVTVYPTHWWTGMKWNQLQLMVRGDKVAATVPMVKMKPEGMELAPGVHLKRIQRVANSNYIFFDLEIAGNAQPGWITLPFVGKKV